MGIACDGGVRAEKAIHRYLVTLAQTCTTDRQYEPCLTAEVSHTKLNSSVQTRRAHSLTRRSG